MSLRKTQNLLIAFYGDDFTGSTDALESLATAGLRAVLFLRPPTRKQLTKFPGLQAFGIAGGSRIMSPREMERELPAAFRSMKASGASIIHYKTCSTFDSSPRIGSIGKAIELGRGIFGQRPTPLIVGSPSLGRYVVFGNLFARSGQDSEPMRLDRHPMSRHPVTPMDEADLCRHLAKQTRLPVELVDILRMRGPRDAIHRLLDEMELRNPAPVILFDTIDGVDVSAVGQVLLERRDSRRQIFCAGSSSVGYAFSACWRKTGVLPARDHRQNPRAQITWRQQKGQIIIVSGSCSPVTNRQVGRAVRDGFVEVPCNTALLADARHSDEGIEAAMALARPALAAGRHIIFHTARGPDDPRCADFEGIARSSAGASARVGRGLAEILQLTLVTTGARRIVICGGDTATQIARTIGVEALEYVASGVAGAPFCRIHAPGRIAHGCQIICKGGQFGPDSFLLDLAERVRPARKNAFKLRHR